MEIFGEIFVVEIFVVQVLLIYNLPTSIYKVTSSLNKQHTSFNLQNLSRKNNKKFTKFMSDNIHYVKFTAYFQSHKYNLSTYSVQGGFLLYRIFQC